MTAASLRLVVVDDDGSVVKTLILDNLDSANEAVVIMDGVAEWSYARTGIVPREPDGTPYWGESDEDLVNE